MDKSKIKLLNIPKRSDANAEDQLGRIPQPTNLTIPNVCDNQPFSAAELIDQGEIGRGAYASVKKMIHSPTNAIMAVKIVRWQIPESVPSKLPIRDLDVVMKAANCRFIVTFYGALFKEGDCLICMQLMETSLDKFYRYVYHSLSRTIPESIIGAISYATVTALAYLKTELSVIHRDVKPSNILLDLDGSIKLCDFGISGSLIDSIARTRDAGCKLYMAPERIDPKSSQGYDIRSDVWSLGITLYEVTTGQFPYPSWNSVFDQLTSVINGPEPRIPASNACSALCREFIEACLTKDFNKRPKYDVLKKFEFFKSAELAYAACTQPTGDGNAMSGPRPAQYFREILESIPDACNLNDIVAPLGHFGNHPPQNAN